jgi:hypothetical protein
LLLPTKKVLTKKYQANLKIFLVKTKYHSIKTLFEIAVEPTFHQVLNLFS